MSDERVLQDTSATAGLRAQVALPTPVAIWVLAAHAIALLTPLLLLWAVYANWVFVSALAAAPGIFYVAVAFMMAASAFEIAQNTADRWYLEPGMGSTDGTALSDFLFYLCNCLGMLGLIAGCMGDLWWLMGACAAIVGAFVFLYLTFGNPIVFLQIVASRLTLYFFALLLKTRAQFLHGCVALASTAGIWVAAWAVYSGAAGRPQGWAFVIALAAAIGLLALSLKQQLERISATPRRNG